MSSSAGARADLRDLCDRAARGLVDGPPLPALVPPEPSAPTREAAVLVLFGVLDAVPATVPAPRVGHAPHDLDVLLQRRARGLRNHPGQISFPGGRLEPGDTSPAAAALREAAEETGLDPRGVEVLGTLPPIPLTVSRHVVTPVPAWWTTPSRVAAVDHAETLDVFRVPVADLLDPAHRANVAVRDGRLSVPAFVLGDDLVVWGFTAFVLDLVFDQVGWTVPWDRTRLVDRPR
ncbi:NUDIX hydrolase [Cellulomonas soli]